MGAYFPGGCRCGAARRPTRIEILHRIFRDLGFAEPEALVRARISYFHQVGYYAVDLPENRQRRLTLVLSGLPMELIVAELGVET